MFKCRNHIVISTYTIGLFVFIGYKQAPIGLKSVKSDPVQNLNWTLELSDNILTISDGEVNLR